MSQASAIKLMNEFAAKNGPSKWSKVDRTAFARGVIERILDPNKVHQRGTPLCGPASLTRAIAKDSPVVYARAAIDLYQRGKAVIKTLEIEAGSELLKSAPQGKTDPADWVFLASIRDSDNWFFSPAGWFGSNAAGITMPDTVAEWFQAAGYTKIVNITHKAAKPNHFSLATEAKKASDLKKKGYKVMLFIDADMLDADTQDDLVSMHPDHWVTLTSQITDGGTYDYDKPVSFQVYSWGRTIDVPVDSKKPLTKFKFLHKYYGFVAAGH
jgi:hypothetical protein